MKSFTHDEFIKVMNKITLDALHYYTTQDKEIYNQIVTYIDALNTVGYEISIFQLKTDEHERTFIDAIEIHDELWNLTPFTVSTDAWGNTTVWCRGEDWKLIDALERRGYKKEYPELTPEKDSYKPNIKTVSLVADHYLDDICLNNIDWSLCPQYEH